MSAKPVKVIGILSIIAGLVLMISGIATYSLVASELSAEKIVVSADATMLPGAKVGDPFSAYAEAEVIKHHALTASEGKTYAELGALASAAKKAGDTALAEKLTAQRTTVMNGSFLRASLFTSVLSFGVSALVIGLGVMLGLIGWALMLLAKPAEAVVAAEPARVAV